MNLNILQSSSADALQSTKNNSTTTRNKDSSVDNNQGDLSFSNMMKKETGNHKGDEKDAISEANNECVDLPNLVVATAINPMPNSLDRPLTINDEPSREQTGTVGVNRLQITEKQNQLNEALISPIPKSLGSENVASEALVRSGTAAKSTEKGEHTLGGGLEFNAEAVKGLKVIRDGKVGESSGKELFYSDLIGKHKINNEFSNQHDVKEALRDLIVSLLPEGAPFVKPSPLTLKAGAVVSTLAKVVDDVSRFTSEFIQTERNTSSELRISLRPLHLGEVKVEISKDGESVKINIVASTEDAKNSLNLQKSELIQSVRDQLNSVKVGVDVNTGGSGGHQSHKNQKDERNESKDKSELSDTVNVYCSIISVNM